MEAIQVLSPSQAFVKFSPACSNFFQKKKQITLFSKIETIPTYNDV